MNTNAHSDKKIIYVDDDEDDMFYFNSAVEKINHGLQMKGCPNGENFVEAIENARHHTPMIFLDINMPEKNGFEMLRELRSNDELKDLPVIMYSTSSDERSIQISRELGADAYAVKPNDIGKLRSIIEKVISMDWSQHRAGPSGFTVIV